MTTRYTKDEFKLLHDELFLQLTQREWRIAGEIAKECRDYINRAFVDGYRDVANYGLKRLDDLVTPVFTQEYRNTAGYDGLWKQKEMHRFIIDHLDFTPQQAVEMINGVTQENAGRVVARLVCVGLLEDALHHPEDARAPLTAHFTIKLAGKLMDIGCHESGLDLLVSLAKSEEVGRSDLFLDYDYMALLARACETVVNADVILEGITENLISIIKVNREGYGYSHRPPHLQDVMKVAAHGAGLVAREMLLTTPGFGNKSIDLRSAADLIGQKFSRSDLILISSLSNRSPDNSDAWFRNALAYWLHEPEMVWPFHHDHKEVDSVQWLIGTPTVSNTPKDLRCEVKKHAEVIYEVIQEHGYESQKAADEAMGNVVRLYLQGHSPEDAVICAQMLADVLPKRVMLTSSRFRDSHFSRDLGL